MTRPSWLSRAVGNRHRHAIEQASRRWRGGRRGDSGRTCRKILISTQANTYILIGSEVLKVTAVSTNSLTVIRGQDGTTATTHLDAAKVFLLKSNVKTVMEPYAKQITETTINEGAAFIVRWLASSLLLCEHQRAPATMENQPTHRTACELTTSGSNANRGAWGARPRAHPRSQPAALVNNVDRLDTVILILSDIALFLARGATATRALRL